MTRTLIAALLAALLTACANQIELPGNDTIAGDIDTLEDPDGGIGGTGIITFH